MMYCETCKFWVAREYSPKGARLCKSEKFGEPLDFIVFPEDGLSYSYDEGGGFYTGPKFGCVHHAQEDQVPGA